MAEDFDIMDPIEPASQVQATPAQDPDEAEYDRIEAMRRKVGAPRGKHHKTRMKEVAQRREEAAQAKAAELFDSRDECSKAEGKDILRNDRLLTQPYIINAVYEMGEMAAKKNHIVPNIFYWRNGVLNSIKSQETQKPHALVEVPNEKAYGEVFRNQDVQAMWDFGISTVPQKANEAAGWEEGHIVTLEEYKKLRNLKADAVQFGNILLEKDYWAEPHGVWRDFLPRPNIDMLPENYSQKDLKRVLASLHDIHQFLICAARSTYKSTFLTTLFMSFICTYYDLRILIASATGTLVKDFIKALRKNYIVEGDMTLFQLVYPELCLYGSDMAGSVLTYECPAARLGLPQPTISGVGLDSTVAGRRCDFLWADDVSENTNSDTEENRASTQRKFDLLTQLIEPYGALVVAATPFAKGDIVDRLIQRNDANTEKLLAFRIDPIFSVKDEALARELAEHPEKCYNLTEDQVTLLFPSRQDWKYIRRKMLTSELKEFAQQQMLLWYGDNEAGIRLNFQKEALYNAIVPPYPVPAPDEISNLVMSLDRAYTATKYSDRSSISLVRIHLNGSKLPSLRVEDNSADRWPLSELAVQIVEKWMQYHPSVVIAEQDLGWTELRDTIRTEAAKRNVKIENIFWRPVTKQKNAKVIRFKSLEGLLNTGRLKFVQGTWNEAVFNECLWVDGRRKSNNGLRKDDRLDSISQVALMLPTAVSPESEELRKAREDNENSRRNYELYQMIHGDGTNRYRYGADQVPTSKEELLAGIPGTTPNRIHQALGERFLKDPSKKQMSFGDLGRDPHRKTPE